MGGVSMVGWERVLVVGGDSVMMWERVWVVCL